KPGWTPTWPCNHECHPPLVFVQAGAGRSYEPWQLLAAAARSRALHLAGPPPHAVGGKSADLPARTCPGGVGLYLAGPLHLAAFSGLRPGRPHAARRHARTSARSRPVPVETMPAAQRRPVALGGSRTAGGGSCLPAVYPS